MKAVKWIVYFTIAVMLVGCVSSSDVTGTSEPTPAAEMNLPNPASAYCEDQGYALEIVTTADGSQGGLCIFPDGSQCDEWAYFRGECQPGDSLPSAVVAATPESDLPQPEEPTPSQGDAVSPTEFPTPVPIAPADYQGWWQYTHTEYGFSIQLPPDWAVEEITTADPLMDGHLLMLHPQPKKPQGAQIRMTFRRVGEDVLLWPTGVGQGEFIHQGTLDVAGQPALRLLLVCPTGEITAIWYHGAEEGQPNIARGDMEFGFIYTAGEHCQPGLNLDGKSQHIGEMIVASLAVP